MIAPKPTLKQDTLAFATMSHWLVDAMFIEREAGTWVLKDPTGPGIPSIDEHLGRFGYLHLLFENEDELAGFLADAHPGNEKARVFVEANLSISSLNILVGDGCMKLAPARASFGQPPADATGWVDRLIRTPLAYLEHPDLFSGNVLEFSSTMEQFALASHSQFAAVQQWNAAIIDAAWKASRGERQSILTGTRFSGSRAELQRLGGEAQDPVLLVTDDPNQPVFLVEKYPATYRGSAWGARTGTAYRLPLRLVLLRGGGKRLAWRGGHEMPLDIQHACTN